MDTDGRFRPRRKIVCEVGVLFRPAFGGDEALSVALSMGAGTGDPRHTGVVAEEGRLLPMLFVTVGATAGEGDVEDSGRDNPGELGESGGKGTENPASA